MDMVRQLMHREVVRQDVEAIAGIYRNLGAPVAEQLVTRALGELILSITALADRIRRQDLQDIRRQFVRLGRMAADIGLVTISRVTTDAVVCLDRSDATAFSAVWARLIRVTEKSMPPEMGMADSLR